MDGTQQNLSDDKIQEALNLLSEAAREKRADFMNLVSDKYSDLRDAFYEGKSSFGQTVSDTTHKYAERFRHASQVGQDRMRDIAAQLDENVHESPWSYIGGVALGALILGFLLGKK